MWHQIPCPASELRLDIVLKCGQSFRWQKVDDVWRSVLFGNVWSLKQDEDVLFYRVDTDNVPMIHKSLLAAHEKIKSERSETIEAFLLRNYFQLDIQLETLYELWCKADPYFARTASTFTGVRMLRQDPVENLFSFICSANNNITRIVMLVEKLCTHYGELVGNVDGKDYYSFPDPEKLAVPGVEQKLRDLGFGYRAKYIADSAKMVTKEHSVDWLHELRGMEYNDVKSQLVKLSGVGPKVADCVCLMSLDQHAALPVDTHVWQFTQKYYLPQLRAAKSLTDRIYTQIGDHFRELWGAYAGWAQSVMFSAELKEFNNLKTESKVKTEKTKKKKLKREITDVESTDCHPDEESRWSGRRRREVKTEPAAATKRQSRKQSHTTTSTKSVPT